MGGGRVVRRERLTEGRADKTIRRAIGRPWLRQKREDDGKKKERPGKGEKRRMGGRGTEKKSEGAPGTGNRGEKHQRLKGPLQN